MDTHLSIQYQELAEGLQKALGLQGSLVGGLEPAMQVGLNILDLTDPEFLWLRRTQRYAAGFQLAAVAAQYAISEIINDVGTGIIAVVSPVIQNTNAAATLFSVYVQPGSPVVPAHLRRINLDARQAFPGGNAPAVCQVTAGNAAAPAPAANAASYWVPANTPTRLPDIILVPGTKIIIQTSAVNLASNIVWEWTERFLQPAEV